jgi:hypothetical protein
MLRSGIERSTKIGHGLAMGGFLSEFWTYLTKRKKFWLMPILIAMVLVGGLTVITKGSAVAPFIYTLF